MKKQSFLMFACIGLLLSSCAVTKLEPGAEKVVVTDSAHLPSGCKKLGQVSAFDTNGTTVTYTSHERLQQYQTTILRNKTFDLGGNVLVITNHQTTYTNKHDNTIDTHLMEGNAYYCSSGLLNEVTPEAHSDIKSAEE